MSETPEECSHPELVELPRMPESLFDYRIGCWECRKVVVIRFDAMLHLRMRDTPKFVIDCIGGAFGETWKRRLMAIYGVRDE